MSLISRSSRSALRASSRYTSPRRWYAFLFATVMACFGNSSAANFMFGNRAVFFPGEISFSIYLVHPLLLVPLKRAEAFFTAHAGSLPSAVSVSITFLAVVALATVSYRLIEVPGKRFMMRLMSRASRNSAERPSFSREGIDAR